MKVTKTPNNIPILSKFFGVFFLLTGIFSFVSSLFAWGQGWLFSIKNINFSRCWCLSEATPTTYPLNSRTTYPLKLLTTYSHKTLTTYLRSYKLKIICFSRCWCF